MAIMAREPQEMLQSHIGVFRKNPPFERDAFVAFLETVFKNRLCTFSIVILQ